MQEARLDKMQASDMDSKKIKVPVPDKFREVGTKAEKEWKAWAFAFEGVRRLPDHWWGGTAQMGGRLSEAHQRSDG